MIYQNIKNEFKMSLNKVVYRKMHRSLLHSIYQEVFNQGKSILGTNQKIARQNLGKQSGNENSYSEICGSAATSKTTSFVDIKSLFIFICTCNFP